jgi:hypothetical protein
MGLDNGDEHIRDDAARFFPSGDRLVVRNADDQKVAEAFRSGEIVIRRQGRRCVIQIQALLNALRRLGGPSAN